MKASELIAKLEALIKTHGDRHVYSEADWSFVHEVEVDDEPHDYCVVAPVNTPDCQGLFESVPVFVLTN